MSLRRGPIKFKIFFLKIEEKGKQPKSEYSLFHSINADGKKKNEKGIPYFRLGNRQVLTISCLAWIGFWRN